MLRPLKYLTFFLAMAGVAHGGSIPVPNASFELPVVVRGEKNPFGALPFIDDWDETAVGPADEFDKNTGAFLNTMVGQPDHIANADLNQLAFVSTLIGNDLRQELGTSFMPGSAYSLTVGVATSLTFPAGATEELEIALFYFDGGVEQVVVSTRVSGSEVTSSALNEFTVVLPPVQGTDAWANMPLGILIRPAVDDPDDAVGEGFWDVDHVRLEQLDAVPAASTWGLMALSVMLVVAGAVLMRRRGALASVAQAS